MGSQKEGTVKTLLIFGVIVEMVSISKENNVVKKIFII